MLSILVGGLTPLMLASSGGDGLDHDYLVEDGAAASGLESSATLITELLNHGAAINAQTEGTGMSSVKLEFQFSDFLNKQYCFN